MNNMKKLCLNLGIIGALIPVSFSISCSLTNDNNKKNFKEWNLNIEKEKFFSLIKDISGNSLPLFIECNGASFSLQQSFFMSMSNYYNNFNNKNMDDIVVQQVYPATKRFYPDILIRKGIWNGIYNIDKINLDNINNFNLLEGFYFKKDGSLDDEWDKNFEKLLSKFNPKNKKIDYVLTDVDFYELLLRFINDYNNQRKNPLNKIFKHVNRIVIISDGAIHTNVVVPELYRFLKDFSPRDRNTVINRLKSYQNNENEKLTIQDVLDFILLKKFETTKENSNFDFISFVNYDGNVQNSLMLSDNKLWTELTCSTNFVEYSNHLNSDSNKTDFLNVFSLLFTNSNTLEEKFINGYEALDLNKRNAIFLGSSLFTPLDGNFSKTNFSRLQEFDNLRFYVQEEMEKLLAKFPPHEYNLIFKLHPQYGQSKEAAIEYIKLITNNQIKNPIILNPSISLETLIANEYYLYFSNRVEDNFMFKTNNNTEVYEWTTFFGLQATSTTIHTTRLFYETTFNLSPIESSKIIPFFNFPIPKKFHLVNKPLNDNLNNKDYYQENYNQILKIYSPFIPSLVFNDEGLKKYDSIILNFDE